MNANNSKNNCDIASIPQAYVNLAETLYTVPGGCSVGQNKLLQLILGCIYILKYLESNSLVRFYSFEIHNL